MFTLPELPFAPESLEPHIDTTTMEIHHGKHHATYVKNLNDALPDKSEVDLANILQNNPEPKVRNNGGGHWNHSFFWPLLSPTSTSPSEALTTALNSSFDSLDTFKEKFTAAALGRFGSGWVWLVKDGAGLAIMDTPNQDNPLMVGKTAILGLDVWEHAYYLKYQNRRADYIAAFWNVVNWAKVSELLVS